MSNKSWHPWDTFDLVPFIIAGFLIFVLVTSLKKLYPSEPPKSDILMYFPNDTNDLKAKWEATRLDDSGNSTIEISFVDLPAHGLDAGVYEPLMILDVEYETNRYDWWFNYDTMVWERDKVTVTTNYILGTFERGRMFKQEHTE